jgi:hypothetical protein
LTGRKGSSKSRKEKTMARYNDESRGNRRSGAMRDDNGQFMSRGGQSRYSDNDYDDDSRGYGGGRGHGRGGWFGDSEGHAQAAREGWGNNRRYSRDNDYDDDNRSSGGGRGHGRGGWYSDSEGHSGAGRGQSRY